MNKAKKYYIDNDGNMIRGVIIRHLVLPGSIDDSKRVIKYLYNTYGSNWNNLTYSSVDESSNKNNKVIVKPMATTVNTYDNYCKGEKITIYNASQQNYNQISSSLKENFPNNKEFDVKYEMLIDISITHSGIIKLIRHKNNKKLFIAKIICKEKLSLKEYKLIKSEIDVIQVCKHPNIILCEEVIEDFDFIYIIMEYMHCGDLEHFINRFEDTITLTIKRNIIIQIIKGVKYLHTHGIMHRDLKPENILLTEQNNELIVKIADFGLSTVLSEFETTNEGYGTIGYVAPEVLTRAPYNHKIDIWSMGVIIYYIISGELPFNNTEDEEKIAKSTVIGNLEFDELIWKNQSIELVEFICNCLEKNPRNRLSFKDLVTYFCIS